MICTPAYQSQPDAAEVLLEAALNAADHLGLKKKELAQIIHLDERTLRRKHGLDAEGTAGQLALLLIRGYRAAFVLMGSSEGARYWFTTPNHALNGTPKELARRIDGLVRIVAYLDAARGKV